MLNKMINIRILVIFGCLEH